MAATDRVIYLAGGCFWGIERLMRALPGVTDATSGYANGSGAAEANYPAVRAGGTGFRETVRVTYAPDRISLDAILFAYFSVIDPTVENRQGGDVGTQYQTGVYWTDDASRETALRVAAVARGRSDAFHVELAPLRNFYPAEEYHQRYLEKNPDGYCHVPFEAIARAARLCVDPAAYPRPDDAALRAKLTPEQLRVTQEGGTEAPRPERHAEVAAKGIYVDVVTGEPLFSSRDRFESGCGWPAFSAPIDPNVVLSRPDASHGMRRTEVRSRAGDSHLGHVFTGEANAPDGVRYCVNRAALRFVPLADMAREGYGALIGLVE